MRSFKVGLIVLGIVKVKASGRPALAVLAVCVIA